MGYISHKAILITIWENNVLMNVLNRASKLFGSKVSGVSHGMNDYKTFVIFPTGSKEGWEPAEKDAEVRKEFLEYLDSFDYEDGSSPIGWVYIMYGDEGAKVLDTNTKNRFKECEET